ncbi:MAG: deoxyribose-phosphate aldolase [Eubacteriales bacterium]|nr:deoxyribose-phosphate aldolase [Eubacteriales bacterium]
MTAKQAARLIDISAVRTHHTLRDIQSLVEIAKAYRFVNVHTLPGWTAALSEMLRDSPDIRIGAPVGFPSGGHTSRVKLMEAEQLLTDGVEEMDIVMNVGRFKNGEFGYVLDELRSIIRLAEHHALTKVIIELNCLDEREMEDACGLVIDSGADFLKTGTGWVAGGANIGRIGRIKELTKGRIMVKAAGGIRTYQDFEALLKLGVERFGINANSAVDIVSHYGT